MGIIIFNHTIIIFFLIPIFVCSSGNNKKKLTELKKKAKQNKRSHTSKTKKIVWIKKRSEKIYLYLKYNIKNVYQDSHKIEIVWSTHGVCASVWWTGTVIQIIALLYFHAIFLGYGFDHRRAELLVWKPKQQQMDYLFENDARGCWAVELNEKGSNNSQQKQRDDDQWCLLYNNHIIIIWNYSFSFLVCFVFLNLWFSSDARETGL